MKIKTFLLVVLTIVITVVLMKNTELINFWFFGDYTFSKLSILLAFFAFGVLFGAVAFRPRKRKDQEPPLDTYVEVPTKESPLSEEDRKFIN
ncbi:hypothetical protein J5U18_04080 [Sphingobacteriaceae bacterium WQ 2009]|uniref:Lipopolysaccharide assembly protein A domain-containing protein n=1 Tax=Rhinopithecimicrobium faecis TaxID=2820698 RepID=A0A8T4H7C6_9SPHI|nr:hypothetical protein [Sphingobacteriaceae bacterium WQ 2009]